MKNYETKYALGQAVRRKESTSADTWQIKRIVINEDYGRPYVEYVRSNGRIYEESELEEHQELVSIEIPRGTVEWFAQTGGFQKETETNQVSVVTRACRKALLEHE